MNKLEFMTLLKSELERLKVQKIYEILADYEEHFAHAARKGIHEEEISRKLGSPLTLAKAYETEALIFGLKEKGPSLQMGSLLSVFLRMLILAPFNFFVIFIPGVIVFSILVAGWSVALAMAATGLGLLTVLPGLVFSGLGFWLGLGGIMASVGIIAITLFSVVMMFLISKFIFKGLLQYFQWNLDFVLQKEGV